MRGLEVEWAKLKAQLGSVRGGKMDLYWKSCPPSGIAFGYEHAVCRFKKASAMPRPSPTSCSGPPCCVRVLPKS